MMVKQNLPLVSVYVVTYNSSKTVIETLDSIYNQTYPNIELIVSDDCSTDSTVELCREWIEKHKDRFFRTEILTFEKNTGVSGNCNRAEAACRGEWVKGIAGDDLLVSDCIETCIEYVRMHEGVVVLFGRQDAFGTDEETRKQINAVFDYEMLTKSPEEQLHKLIFDKNYIPATTLFYHRERMRATGVICDPRIPLLDDWPKWINLLRAGVKFNFVDRILVKYRVGGISNTGGYNSKMFKAERLMLFYYQYPAWCQENQDDAIKRVVDFELELYNSIHEANQYYNTIAQSLEYKVGRFIIRPIKILRRLLVW